MANSALFKDFKMNGTMEFSSTLTERTYRLMPPELIVRMKRKSQLIYVLTINIIYNNTKTS
jgi:hypothetical protein